jgi:hypothetical protein
MIVVLKYMANSQKARLLVKKEKTGSKCSTGQLKEKQNSLLVFCEELEL